MELIAESGSWPYNLKNNWACERVVFIAHAYQHRERAFSCDVHSFLIFAFGDQDSGATKLRPIKINDKSAQLHREKSLHPQRQHRVLHLVKVRVFVRRIRRDKYRPGWTPQEGRKPKWLLHLARDKLRRKGECAA